MRSHTINRGSDAEPLKKRFPISHSLLPIHASTTKRIRFDLFIQRCLNEAQEQGMRLVGAAFEFGMKLDAHKEILVG